MPLPHSYLPDDAEYDAFVAAYRTDRQRDLA